MIDNASRKMLPAGPPANLSAHPARDISAIRTATAVRRRDLIALVGGAAAWPLSARAQPLAMPVIGFLNIASARAFASFVAAFHSGLNAGGYVEGRNVAIEYRWAEGDYDRLREQAADLVDREVAVIVAAGGTTTALLAKKATKTIPVLFISGANPVVEGLVSSFSRPEGNATGVSVYTSELTGKRLQLLRELLPRGTMIALLGNPSTIVHKLETKDLKEAADAAGLPLLSIEVATESGFEAAFASAVRQRAGGLLVSADPFFTSKRNQIVELAARHRLPAAYPWREYAVAGGLMSYGASIPEAYRLIGEYTARILKGANPGDLPVRQPTTFDLVLNIKAGKALGLQIPVTLLATADEVIE
jgi:putative ABC transport system substrate-binding protein